MSTDYVSLLPHCEVKKIACWAIISWGLSVVMFPISSVLLLMKPDGFAWWPVAACPESSPLLAWAPQPSALWWHHGLFLGNCPASPLPLGAGKPLVPGSLLVLSSVSFSPLVVIPCQSHWPVSSMPLFLKVPEGNLFWFQGFQRLTRAMPPVMQEHTLAIPCYSYHCLHHVKASWCGGGRRGW